MDKSVAILARTNMALRVFEQALSEKDIKYYLVGKSGFWSQSEVRTSLAFLQAAVYPSDYVLGTCIRSPFAVSKYLPKQKLCARLKEMREADDTTSWWKLLTTEAHSLVENKNLESVSNFVSFIHGLSRYKSLPAGDALKQILGALRAGDYYAEEEACPDNDPLANLAELIKLAARYSTIKEFTDYARKVTAASRKKSGVALSTIHSAKGLQWTDVWLVGCQEGVLPHAKSSDLEGERNCFFVACSRAERQLVITYSGIPSSFLKEKLNA